MDEMTGARKLFFKTVDYTLVGIFNFTKIISRIFPLSVIYGFFNLLGYAIFYGRPRMREGLLLKLSDALPEINDRREIARIGREVCTAYIMSIMDYFVFWKYGERYMGEMRIEGLEYFDRADKQGKGVFVLAAHHGAAVLIHAIMARLGRPYTPILWHPDSTPLPRFVTTMALFGQSLGCDPEQPVFWAGQDTIKKVREHLAKGKRVGLTFDVEGSHVVDFFGRPAAIASGIAHFAYDSGAPIVPICHLRGKRLADRRLVIYEPLSYQLTGDRKQDIAIIMREVVKAGERQIREDPGQYWSWFGLWAWWEKAEELMRKES